MAKCSATRADGSPCKGDAIAPAAYCWAHDPAHAAARQRNATRGGKAGGKGRPATEIHTIKGELRTLIDQVKAGEIERGTAITINLLLNTLLRSVELERKQKEQDEYDVRIAALEAIVAQGRHSNEYRRPY